MMSISPLKSASNASKYYLAEENPNALPDMSLEQQGDNYYLKEQSQGDHTFWYGKLAKEAGLLNQAVDEKTLQTVLSGTLNGETIKGKREHHRAGFDLTFSAPKNASILALVGGDTRLIDAHNNAVKFALSELEKDIAQVKATHEKGVQTYDNTDSMIFAVVRHKTSRNNDPQVHSHALAANMTRDQQGELRALASCLKQQGGVINGSGERIYHFQKYYTALYQSHYAKSAQELGYTIHGLGKGQFDIKGVPESLHKAFSTRKQQIDQQVLEFGYNTQACRDTAALNTRPRKTYHSDANLNHQWQHTVIGLGYDPSGLVSHCLKLPKTNHDIKHQALEAFSRAVAHLGQYSTSLNLEKVIEIAATDFTKGAQQANAIDLKHIADQWIREGKLLPLAHRGQYTTKAMLQTEKALMAITHGRSHHMRTTVDDATLAGINISQRHSVAGIYTSTKQFHVVDVSGSSEQIAQHLLNAGNHSGKRVHLISQSAKDRQLNQRKIVRDSYTLSTWARHLFHKEQRHTLQGLLHSELPLTNKDILLVDSANKMSADELIALSEKARQTNSKVILLNRISSWQGLKAHDALTLYRKGNVVQHRWVNAKQGDSQVRLHQQDTHTVARRYTDLPDKTNCQVLATSRVEQRRLTDEIRATLRNDGQLSRTGVTLITQQAHYLSKPQQELARYYKPGMMLRQWQEGRPLDFVITSVDKGANIIEALSKTDGKTHTFAPCSKAFKSMNIQVFKADCLEISQGERLVATSKHFPSGIEAGQRYYVTAINRETLTVTNIEGKPATWHRDTLKDVPLSYDYVHAAHHIEPKTHTLLSGKAFTLSKALLNDLTEHSRNIDIFTDHPDKALHALEKADSRASAIERVLDTEAVNDHYVSKATEPILRQDIEQALRILTTEQQRPAYEKAVSFALNHLSEKEAAFTQKALVVEAIRYAFEETNTSVTKAHIESELAKRSDALSAQYNDGTRWTTQSAIDAEKHILSNIEKGKNQHDAFASSKQAQTYLDEQSQLTQGQKDAIHLITTTRDSFVAIQGLAGTGKSTMLESNIALIEQTRHACHTPPERIIGLAPTHSAVSELETKGIRAQTLESLLTDVRRGVTTPEEHKHTLYFLDESSMVSNQQAKALTDFVLESQSKAVLLGDKEQLLSLSAGKPFELAMTKGLIDSAQMTDIIRQRNKEALGAVHNILDKQPDSALDKLTQQAPDSQGKSQHVISTFEDNPKDPRQAQQIATEKLPYEVAQDYLSRTQETRENTLIIAYTNQERDAISEHIRHGLIGLKELGTENIMAPRLRSTGASGEELNTMMPYKEGLILSTRPGEYATITMVDSEHGVVMIQNQDTGKEQAFLPRHRDHKFTALFAVSQVPLSTGDKIVTRYTDKSRGIKANVVHHVIKASHQAILAQDKDGRTLSIDPSQIKDGHWDYAYTRTADMAQGATYQNVITSIKGKGALTNLRRAYIDLTRASEHIRLYTDNPKQMMRNWLSREVNKASAIETLQQIPPQSTIYFNDAPLVHEDVRYRDHNGDFDYNLLRERVHSELPRYTESLAEQLLGKPNHAKSDQDYLTFGSGKSAIKVSLTGEYRGYFKDYTTGEKGSLINLMMSAKALTYKEAMNEAHQLLNDPARYQLIENRHHDTLIDTTPRRVAQFEQRAKQYLEESLDIKGTLVEQYLNQLGVKEASHSHVRFHPAVYSSEDSGIHPAMLTNIHNQCGETRAIEITYLDYHGNKASALDINPRILGTKSKHMTQFNQGQDRNTTIISTGIEPSFIINEHTQGRYDIVNVSHKNDIQNLSPDELRQNIIIVLTRENQDINPNNVEKIMEKFASCQVHFVTEENMLKQISDCISLFEGQDKLLMHDVEFDASTIKRPDIPADPIVSSVQREKDREGLEYCEPKERSSQQELDFNRETSKELGHDRER
ncbi:conjugative transfer relaxase/helicase TraI [Vibrio brasiliensis]|uniref:conjugative transfer relaxase/helicase TraI n=1 Tax=Vibrio brasiliensis TaxID=170652 RepID=UPI001EFEE645|nr:conjugative transfer relaxase/helicase TraI [Vibrio brasiliensis]MCG9727503.1 conjugative transfer relaxase/helicase TraI [Vibrio brasiliensis]